MQQTLLETLRSIKRSLFTTILLVCEFVLLFYTALIVLCYYVDVPVNSSLEMTENHRNIYYLYTDATNQNELNRANNQMLSSIFSPGYHVTINAALNTLQKEESFTLIRCKEGAVALPADEIIQRLEGVDIGPYLAKGYFVNAIVAEHFDRTGDVENIQELVNDGTPRKDSFSGTPVIDLSSFLLDMRAVDTFGLSVQAGRLFTAAEYEMNNAQKYRFPVLMGSGFAPYYTLGERFTYFDDVLFRKCEAEIVGFLSHDTEIAVSEYFSNNTAAANLDYSIVRPTQNPTYKPAEIHEEYTTIQLYADVLNQGAALVIPADTPRETFTELQRQVKDVFLQNGLAPMLFGSPSYGLLYFQNETTETVSLLTGLCGVMMVFLLITIALLYAAKIDKDLRRFAIQQMNGRSLPSIIGSFLLEIMLVLAVSGATAFALFLRHVYLNANLVILLAALTLIPAALLSCFVTYKLSSISIEEFIRRSDL